MHPPLPNTNRAFDVSNVVRIPVLRYHSESGTNGFLACGFYSLPCNMHTILGNTKTFLSHVSVSQAGKADHGVDCTLVEIPDLVNTSFKGRRLRLVPVLHG